MRSHRKAWSGLCAALLGLSGCWSTDAQLKPPPPPPEYILPPADDPRFSEPPAFPAKAMNEGQQPKKDADGPGGLRGPGAGRMGGGMGPGGY
jgi:hypothetical protein